MPTLVLHPGALGDVLQAVPALAALRERGDTRPIVFAGQPRFGTLLSGTGVVDSALSSDALGLGALFARDDVPAEVGARLSRFDRVISWFGARDEFFPSRLRAIVRDVLIAPPVPPADSSLPVWRHLVATLAAWRVSVPGGVEPLAVPQTWRARARAALSDLGAGGRPLLVVHPGAGGAHKRWTVDGYAAVLRDAVRQTDCQVLVHQGPADGDAAGVLCQALGRSTLRLVEPELDLLAAIVREAGAFLGGDSGVSHLAAAVGARAVILFPPATREPWTPWSPTAEPMLMPAPTEDIAPVARALIERLAVSAVRDASYP